MGKGGKGGPRAEGRHARDWFMRRGFPLASAQFARGAALCSGRVEDGAVGSQVSLDRRLQCFDFRVGERL